MIGKSHVFSEKFNKVKMTTQSLIATKSSITTSPLITPVSTSIEELLKTLNNFNFILLIFILIILIILIIKKKLINFYKNKKLKNQLSFIFLDK